MAADPDWPDGNGPQKAIERTSAAGTPVTTTATGGRHRFRRRRQASAQGRAPHPVAGDALACRTTLGEPR